MQRFRHTLGFLVIVVLNKRRNGVDATSCAHCACCGRQGSDHTKEALRFLTIRMAQPLDKASTMEHLCRHASSVAISDRESFWHTPGNASRAHRSGAKTTHNLLARLKSPMGMNASRAFKSDGMALALALSLYHSSSCPVELCLVSFSPSARTPVWWAVATVSRNAAPNSCKTSTERLARQPVLRLREITYP